MTDNQAIAVLLVGIVAGVIFLPAGLIVVLVGFIAYMRELSARETKKRRKPAGRRKVRR